MKDKEERTRETESLVIAIEINRAQIAAALVDSRARSLIRSGSEMPSGTARTVIATLTKLILELAASAERGRSEIRAMGIGVAGTVDSRTGRVSIPGLKGWDRVSLRRMIEEGLEHSGVDIRTAASVRRARAERRDSAHPVIVIESDRIALAAAEAWCGVAEGRQNVIFLSIGSEVWAGIIAHGHVIHGAGDLAGAVGWFALGDGFKNEYAIRGCFETEVAGTALVRRALEEWTGHTDSLLSRLAAADAAQLTPETIIRAARAGDALALRVVTEVCELIGRGVADLISMLNPEMVVLGGELGLALRPFLNQIRREARLWAQPAAAKQCRIVSSVLGQKATLLGAARLAWLQLGQAA